MVQAQSRLARQFAAGQDPDEIGDASNVEVRATNRDGYDAFILGYGHAVYAVRRDDGTPVLFDGWRDYGTPSTKCQLTELRKGFRDGYGDDFVMYDEGMPKQRNFHEYDEGPAKIPDAVNEKPEGDHPVRLYCTDCDVVFWTDEETNNYCPECGRVRHDTAEEHK
jgi:hypothetical protein